MNKLILTCLLYLSLVLTPICKAHSENETLTPDETISGSDLISFPNNARTYPDRGEFELLHSIIMSNKKGERWATITVINNAQGNRTLDQDHILALMANGDRRFPLAFEQKIRSQQTISILINFGKSQFPILKITTRN